MFNTDWVVAMPFDLPIRWKSEVKMLWLFTLFTPASHQRYQICYVCLLISFGPHVYSVTTPSSLMGKHNSTGAIAAPAGRVGDDENSQRHSCNWPGKAGRTDRSFRDGCENLAHSCARVF